MRVTNEEVTNKIDITLSCGFVKLEIESSKKGRDGEIQLNIGKPAEGIVRHSVLYLETNTTTYLIPGHIRVPLPKGTKNHYKRRIQKSKSAEGALVPGLCTVLS